MPGLLCRPWSTQFTTPSGVAVLDGRLYVSDITPDLPRICVFNASTGDYLFAFGGPGTGAGKMDEPYSLAAGGGVLYVADRNLNRVSIFDAQGT